MSMLIDLKQELKDTEKLVEFYHYATAATYKAMILCSPRVMHRETFIRHLCQQNDIDFIQFQEVVKFIHEYTNEQH